MSAEIGQRIPESLSRLIDQHPAAIRSVCFSEEAIDMATPDLAHLEIETKHGQVTLIDHRTGEAYANPPVPPGAAIRNRQQRDLSDQLPGAFADRPRFSSIEPLQQDGRHSGWHFELDTGAAFTLTLDERLPIVATRSS